MFKEIKEMRQNETKKKKKKAKMPSVTFTLPSMPLCAFATASPLSSQRTALPALPTPAPRRKHTDRRRRGCRLCFRQAVDGAGAVVEAEEEKSGSEVTKKKK